MCYSAAHLFSFLCCVVIILSLCLVLCLVFPMLPMSLVLSILDVNSNGSLVEYWLYFWRGPNTYKFEGEF